jgi:hypothetical protein
LLWTWSSITASWSIQSINDCSAFECRTHVFKWLTYMRIAWINWKKRFYVVALFDQNLRWKPNVYKWHSNNQHRFCCWFSCYIVNNDISSARNLILQQHYNTSCTCALHICILWIIHRILIGCNQHTTQFRRVCNTFSKMGEKIHEKFSSCFPLTHLTINMLYYIYIIKFRQWFTDSIKKKKPTKSIETIKSKAKIMLDEQWASFIHE